MTSVTLETLQSFEEKVVKEWFERFDALCILSKIQEADKVSALISYIGGTAYSILSDNFAPKSVAENSYVEIRRFLVGYKSTDVLIAVARYNFSRIKQLPNENVSQLFNRLNSAAIPCKFDKNKDNRLRDQLVVSPKELVLKIQAIEAIKEGITTMTEGKQTDTHHFSQVGAIQRRKPLSTIKNCFRCGRNHPPRKCPAYRAECDFCHRVGHFSSVCRKKNAKHNSTLRKPNDGISSRFNMKKGVVENFVESKDDTSYASILSVTQFKDQAKFEVVISINGTPINFFLDTGAQVTVLREDIARHLNLQIQRTKKQLFSYDGAHLNVIGQVSVKMQWDGVVKVVDLFVVKSNSSHHGLLGNDCINLFQKTVCINTIDTDSGIRSIEIDIGLKESFKPIFLKHRPIAIGLREKVKNEIENLVKRKIIEKVEYSEWATPIVVVPKPDGRIRMCGDYKVTLNKMIADVSVPTLSVEEMLAEIKSASFFSKIDLEGAYLQLKLNDASKLLTTINTPWGLYRYNRLPFGIKSAPGIFQTTMLKILNGLEGILVYLDDILIFGSTLKEEQSRLDQLMKRLKEYNVKLNSKKCEFHVEEINFLVTY